MKNDKAKENGEKIASLETSMADIDRRLTGIERSIDGLGVKFDTLTKLIAENYVAKDTFDQYKNTLSEKERNKNLEKTIWFIVGAVISGLVAFFFANK